LQGEEALPEADAEPVRMAGDGWQWARPLHLVPRAISGRFSSWCRYSSSLRSKGGRRRGSIQTPLPPWLRQHHVKGDGEPGSSGPIRHASSVVSILGFDKNFSSHPGLTVRTTDRPTHLGGSLAGPQWPHQAREPAISL